MGETGKISLKCPHCGWEFQCKAPSSTGNYSVPCTNPDCRKKVSFHYPLTGDAQQVKPKTEVKFGILEDGSYRFKCQNEACRQSVLVPANIVKIGHNIQLCPKCKTPHEFEIEPTEKDLLKCQTTGCDGILELLNRKDDIYTIQCKKCQKGYIVEVEGSKIKSVRLKTEIGWPRLPKERSSMILVSGHFLCRKVYTLSKGIHYVGRLDDVNKSDFEIKDKYASSRSVRIDVNEDGGNLVYKLTVERAMNPVYHNNHELTIGDVVYLTYGDTLKLGKTLIKVQKAKS